MARQRIPTTRTFDPFGDTTDSEFDFEQKPPQDEDETSAGNWLATTFPEPTFCVPFSDKGAGEVRLTETYFGATPTFTRATTATTVLANGLVASVASGIPRSYYDPTSGEYLGYLPEPQRTNLILRSEDFSNASWQKTRSTISANAITAPDGTLTADKLVEDATAANTHFTAQSITKAASSLAYALSVWVKTGERTKIRLQSDDNVADGVRADFDIGAGTVAAPVNIGAGVGTATTSLVNYANGWTRCSLSFTASSTQTTQFMYVFLLDATGTVSYDGNGASGLYLWGAQMEQATFPTTYIPTVAASVQRNPDDLRYTTAGWYNSASGTFFAQFIQPALVDNGSVASIVGVSDVSLNNRISGGISNAGSSGPYRVVSGGVASVSLSGNLARAVGMHRLVYTYNTNDFRALIDALADITPDTSVTPPTGITTMFVGNSEQGIGSTAPGAPIRRVAYWAGAAMEDAALQYLSRSNSPF